MPLPFPVDQMFWLSIPQSAQTATQIYGGSCGATANATTSTTTIFFPNIPCFQTPPMLVDEEDYLNNIEYYELARRRGVSFQIRTAEQRRLAEEETARANAQLVAMEARRREASRRAHELLVENLTAEQRRTFESYQWFIVVGGRTRKRYRILTDRGYTGNIYELNGDRQVASLCCHCHSGLPEYDQFLAQKLSLMFDEDNFLRTANRHPILRDVGVPCPS